MKGYAVAFVLGAATLLQGFGADAHGSVPAAKATPLDLYLTSRDAYEMVTADPDILFIDVRDPVEISLDGHPEPVDAIVPIKLFSDVISYETGDPELVENPGFLGQMDRTVAAAGRSKADRIIVSCGNGRRSALAVRRLAAAGYTDVWHIPDGYPGDEAPGRNTDNAWRMAGLPWSTTAIVPGSAWALLFEDAAE